MYKVNEIFFSLQGEGMRAGTANFFVRLSGCNLRCKEETHGFDCDTEFTSGREMSGKEILDFCKELSPSCLNVIFTGGEPALQLDRELLTLFKDCGFYTCIETNGTKNLEHLFNPVTTPQVLDWITLSPKIAEHALKCINCSELKYVRGYGQAIPEPVAMRQYSLISPAHEGGELDAKTLQWCIGLVKQNPTWRLSCQQHKRWKVR